MFLGNGNWGRKCKIADGRRRKCEESRRKEESWMACKKLKNANGEWNGKMKRRMNGDDPNQKATLNTKWATHLFSLPFPHCPSSTNSNKSPSEWRPFWKDNQRREKRKMKIEENNIKWQTLLLGSTIREERRIVALKNGKYGMDEEKKNG